METALSAGFFIITMFLFNGGGANPTLSLCAKQERIKGSNCSIICHVSSITSNIVFKKDNSDIALCAAGFCGTGIKLDDPSKTAILAIGPLTFSDTGVYSCSENGIEVKDSISVLSDIMTPNLLVNSSVQAGFARISYWCLTNHSRENLKYELQDTDEKVMEGAAISVEMDNAVDCEYPEESSYSMLVQMKKEYCSGQVVYGKEGFRVSVKLGQQEKAIALNYTCEAQQPTQVCVCSKRMSLGVVAAASIMGVIIYAGQKRQWFQLKSVPKFCVLYGTIVIMSLLVTLILDFTVVTCNCAVRYGAGIGLSFACDTILFCLLIYFCKFDGGGTEDGVVIGMLHLITVVPQQSMKTKPENDPFVSKPQDVPNLAEKRVPQDEQESENSEIIIISELHV